MSRCFAAAASDWCDRRGRLSDTVAYIPGIAAPACAYGGRDECVQHCQFAPFAAANASCIEQAAVVECEPASQAFRRSHHAGPLHTGHRRTLEASRHGTDESLRRAHSCATAIHRTGGKHGCTLAPISATAFRSSPARAAAGAHRSRGARRSSSRTPGDSLDGSEAASGPPAVVPDSCGCTNR